MAKKSFFWGFRIASAIMLIVVLLSACATMFHTKETKLVAESGAAAAVKVLDNTGATVYSGNLPATFPVNPKRKYAVVYTKNGQEQRGEIGKQFNSAFLLNLLLGGLVGMIIDVATGNVMQFEKSTALPIAYSPSSAVDTIILTITDFVPNGANVKVIGNIYTQE